MNRSEFAVGAVALAFLVGFGLSAWAPWSDSQPETAHAPQPPAPGNLVLPVAAQHVWFPLIGEYAVEALTEEQFDALLTTLQERMEAQVTLDNLERECRA